VCKRGSKGIIIKRDEESEQRMWETHVRGEERDLLFKEMKKYRRGM
jgi:hypothetical protein